MEQNEHLQSMIEGCRRDNPLSQKQLYRQFYRYGMTLCSRYARSDEEAEEMLNDAFLRVFTKLHLYDSAQGFPTWFHTICVRTALNYLKKYDLKIPTADLDLAHTKGLNSSIFDQLSTEYITNLVQKLATSYRTVFNLAIFDGYSHVEIADMLGITEGTSRSNLMIARQKLQAMIVSSERT